MLLTGCRLDLATSRPDDDEVYVIRFDVMAEIFDTVEKLTANREYRLKVMTNNIALYSYVDLRGW